jgi:hypothetical protein
MLADPGSVLQSEIYPPARINFHSAPTTLFLVNFAHHTRLFESGPNQKPNAEKHGNELAGSRGLFCGYYRLRVEVNHIQFVISVK